MMYARAGHPENRREFPTLFRRPRMSGSGPSTEWPPGAPPPQDLPGGDDGGRPVVEPSAPDTSEPAPQPEAEPPAGGDQAE